MAASVTVQGDADRIVRHLNATTKTFIPTVAAQAINEVAKKARTEAQREVATKLRLPLRIIRKRVNRQGEIKGDRTLYYKASRNKPTALLRVYHRGIPIHQIATSKAQTKKGVKAKGGRLYKGAFIAQGGRAKGLALKRRSSTGKQGGKLFVPKLSVKKTLEDSFDKRINGRIGRAAFSRAFARRLEARLVAEANKRQ